MPAISPSLALRTIDWEAVATLVEQLGAPSAVLDRELVVMLLDPRLAQLMGIGDLDVRSARLADVCGADALCELVAGALLGEPQRGLCRIVTARGRSVELVVEALRVGADDHASVIVAVKSAFEHVAADADRRNLRPIEYEIGASLTSFGRLARLATCDGVHHYWAKDGPRCHEVIHASSSPCADCPALRRGSSGFSTVRAPRREGGPYEVLDVRASGPRVQVAVRRVDEREVVAIYLARLRATKSVAGLTDSERAVFEQLVAGRSPSAITAQLGISLRRVRRHQAAILRKLDLGTRGDLIRLLF